MPSLRIIYDVEGWAFYHQAMALRKYAPAHFEISLGCLPGMLAPENGRRGVDQVALALGDAPVDVIFLLTATRIEAVRDVLQRRGWPSLLVAEWSDGVPRRLNVFPDYYPSADAWIINNQAYWDAIGRLPRSWMIANGVDLEVFRITRPTQRRTARVLWVGSQLHRQLKGYDDFIVPLRKRLAVAGIDSDVLLVDSYGDDKRTPAQMAEWYNGGTVLVCVSESEGTPNPALEAAACGCTIVSTRVGNMPELIEHGVNGYLVERNLDAIVAATRDACENHRRLSEAMQGSIESWHWAKRAAEFFGVFDALFADGKRRPPSHQPSRKGACR